MQDLIPAKPTLALTLALAGKRTVDARAAEPLRGELRLVFDILSARLDFLAARAGSDDPLALTYSGQSPKLTLITGLADGADQLGADIFLRERPSSSPTGRVLGAILPCERGEFVRNSFVENVVAFDRLWNDCAFVLDLAAEMPEAPERRLDPPAEAPAHDDRRRRGDAFTAQSDVLLRSADILIAVDAPYDVGRPGGTRETVRKALDVGLPVLLLRLGEPGLAVLRTRADFDEPTMMPGPDAHAAIERLVDELIGYLAAPHEDDYARAVTAELFAGQVPDAGWLPRVWAMFEGRFKVRPEPRPGSPAAPAAYHAYKERASRLSTVYAGLYRGSFLAGYGMAVVAISAAVLSLALMSIYPPTAVRPAGVLAALFGLGLIKLAAVVSIFLLARRAHDRRLAHRAADFRYLTERLRAMQFLPEVGWMRAPTNWSLPYTTRVAAHGVMDRLLASILRQADPLHTLSGMREGRLIRLRLRDAERTIRDDWLAEQAEYHRCNHATLEAMSRWLETTNRVLNAVVIGAAAGDLGLLGYGVAAPWAGPAIERVTPFVITIAAVVPAIVASFNGVRFQSECTRLADRSKQMAVELRRVAARPSGGGDHRPTMIEVLRLAEDATRLTLGEVAEWSAIYGKDFPEI